MKKKIFLMELKVENIPSHLLKKLSLSIYNKFIQKLKKENFFYKKIKWFSTPRRLAIKIKNIHLKNQEKYKIYKGPATEIAFDKKGKKTQITKIWMKKFNISSNKIKILKIKKKKYLTYQKKKKINYKKKLAQITKKILYSLSYFYSMRWNEKKYKFIRPIRNILMILNKKVIKYKIFGLKTNNYTQSYLYNTKKDIKILNAKDYPKILLEKGKVIANYEKRKQKLHSKIIKLASKNNSYLKINNSLLEEVNSLIEYPHTLIVPFQKKYLFIPQEINIYIIEKILKSFPLFNKKNKLKSIFIIVINIKKKNHKKIISGYQSVILSKLQDVLFFLKRDTKEKIKKKKKSLKKVIFYKNLGNMYEKSNRLKKIITFFQKKIQFNLQEGIRAASLSKCDIITHMVTEFPDLQGIIGSYYAKVSNESKNIYQGIREQYLPKYKNDKLPKTSIGIALSISDKLDNIVGMFMIGQKPKGEKDPFALRRAAIGIIKIIIQNKISLNLNKIIKKIIMIYNVKISSPQIYKKIVIFIIKRFNNFYCKEKNIKNIIQSVISIKKINLLKINKKIQMILKFIQSNDFKEILITNKRIENFFKKKSLKLPNKIKKSLLKKNIEKKLVKKIGKLKKKIHLLNFKKKYNQTIIEIIKINKYIKKFFNTVKINNKIEEIKINRFTILNKIKKIFSMIANFSYLY
ncbi:glycine--tRNA ligase subunit beta [Buchnera aphidicola]|uniref:glycine--tRNA ligase subunit beta n=1 Tax=Buchnera aphidicola TaxID=9 RepID=UPI0020939C91|nr:glycine--tRNA ligase subunit beta [Buchnera aphidicola]USS94224.1 glycine--tRNA ligase subunit beta [Buchnera aphidicola (Sipha maydis)]WII23772.1 glycine--tRNA ligase subunit beta [Buchnera aphidicola (Sipha maydis)]